MSELKLKNWSSDARNRVESVPATLPVFLDVGSSQASGLPMVPLLDSEENS